MAAPPQRLHALAVRLALHALILLLVHMRNPNLDG
jgi:hypothetical protein